VIATFGEEHELEFFPTLLEREPLLLIPNRADATATVDNDRLPQCRLIGAALHKPDDRRRSMACAAAHAR
jgi:hypothetical protein